jgi:pyruvate dehydrogenase E2 component (dihydrolipoamide acetyltransferase)
MTTFNLPDLGEGLPEAEIVAWLVKEGDRVKLDQPMVSVETAKAVVEVPSPYAGVIRTLHAKAGDIVATGQPLVDFDVEGAAAAPSKPAAPAPRVNPKKADDSGTVVGSMPATSEDEFVDNAIAGSSRTGTPDRVRAAPAVRALAKRMGVELSSVKGSGRGGLITVDDVMSSTGQAPAAAPTSQVSTPHTGPVPTGAAARAPSRPATPVGTEPERLRGLRRGMAHSMAQSRDSIASCTLFDDADLHAWIRKSDYTTRLLRALAAACAAEPGLNAHFDAEAQTRQVFQRVDVAVAVDTPEGLIVPVIRDVAGKQPEQLRQALNGIKEAARGRTVTAEDMRDFTIMLSNFGMIAGRYATPLVVPPAVAILGSGKLQHDVVAVMGGIEVHLRMPLSLTFDHRCVTGGEAARFLGAVIQDLEQPE